MCGVADELQSIRPFAKKKFKVSADAVLWTPQLPFGTVRLLRLAVHSTSPSLCTARPATYPEDLGRRPYTLRRYLQTNLSGYPVEALCSPPPPGTGFVRSGG